MIEFIGGLILILVVFLYAYFPFFKAAFNRNVKLKIIIDEYKDFINDIEKECNRYFKKTKISYCFFLYLNNNKILKSKSVKNRIIFTRKWLEKILFEKDKWEICFVQTIGHELGHKFSNDIKYKNKPEKEAHFVNWTRECRCDHIGFKFAMEYYKGKFSLKEILDAFDKKIQNPDKISLTHPSWNFRKDMIKYYECFNEMAVKKIAKEAGLDLIEENDCIKHISELAVIYDFNKFRIV